METLLKGTRKEKKAGKGKGEKKKGRESLRCRSTHYAHARACHTINPQRRQREGGRRRVGKRKKRENRSRKKKITNPPCTLRECYAMSKGGERGPEKRGGRRKEKEKREREREESRIFWLTSCSLVPPRKLVDVLGIGQEEKKKEGEKGVFRAGPMTSFFLEVVTSAS